MTTEEPDGRTRASPQAGSRTARRRGCRRARDIRQREKIKAELDDLLDEIDEVLETNAEDFVKSYIQKGGQ